MLKSHTRLECRRNKYTHCCCRVSVRIHYPTFSYACRALAMASFSCCVCERVCMSVCICECVCEMVSGKTVSTIRRYERNNRKRFSTVAFLTHIADNKYSRFSFISFCLRRFFPSFEFPLIFFPVFVLGSLLFLF